MNIKKPKADSLYESLKAQINAKVLPENSKLPSETELIDMYGVSRYAARKAIEQLAQDNLVRKYQGKGCYVCPIQPLSSSSSTSKQILLIASRAEHFYFLKSINGIERALQDSGYILTIKLSNYNPTVEADLLKEAFSENYAGLLIFPSESAYLYTNLYLYKYIENRQIPCIILGNRLPCVNLPSVITDDYIGGRIAAEYFLQKGHTSFVCIMNREEYSACMRYAGFSEGLNSAGKRVDSQSIIWFGHNDKDSMFDEQASEILKLAAKSTAFFCFNDAAAVNLYQLLTNHGYHIPQDISIIGYDDSYLCETNPTPLTALHQDPQLAGYTAAQNLLYLIGNPAYDCNKVFRPYLVERNSVADLT